jgi:hypothetical protein
MYLEAEESHNNIERKSEKAKLNKENVRGLRLILNKELSMNCKIQVT